MLLALPNILINSTSNDLFTLLFVVMAFLLAYVWRNFIIVFIHKVRELLLSSDWRSFQAENANSGTRLRIVLSLVNLFSVSIFLYHISHFLGIINIPYYYYLLCLTGFHLLKIIVTAILSYVFTLRQEFVIWVESYVWIHFICGVVFFPLAFLLTYSPAETMGFCTYFGVSVLILVEILIIYRLTVVFYQGIVSFLYLFLYLCALEFLPLLTTYRLLS